MAKLKLYRGTNPTASNYEDGSIVLNGTNKSVTFRNDSIGDIVLTPNTDTKVTTVQVNPTSETYYYGTLCQSANTSTVSFHDGFITSCLNGTTSTDGIGKLILGNGTASGTANNKTGILTLYSPGTGGGSLKQAKTNNWISHTLPTTSGTILNDASSLNPSKLSSAVPITKGGTGATARATGLTNLLSGSGITSATNTDWNSVVDSGIYRVTSITAGTNAPTDVYEFGHLLVVNLQDAITQVYMSHHHDIVVRQSWNGGGEDTSIYWTNWSKVAINISSGTSEPPSTGTAGSIYVQYSE